VKKCLALAALCALFAAGCGKQGRKLNGTGSTFVAPLMSKWEAEYKTQGVELDYEALGSTAGVQRLSTGVFGFACTEAPLGKKQSEALTYAGGAPVRIPLVIGAVAVAYHLDGVTEPLTLDGKVLADIFLGTVTKWDDPKIKKLNEGVKLPALEIQVVHRLEGSGTTYLLTEYLAKVSPAWKDKVGVGATVKWPAGVGAPGTKGVAAKVKEAKGAIGYLQLHDAKENKLQIARVKNRDGAAVEPGAKSAAAAAQNALSEIPDDLEFSLADAPGKDAYPVCGAVYAVVFKKQPAACGKAVVDFLRWALNKGQQYAPELDYARLPKKLVVAAEKKLNQIALGK
jgi:phosphate transport system substrate-binding protein